MPIRSCLGEGWVGAASAIVPPITAEDCAKYPAFNELVAEEGVADRGCTVRGGVGYAKRTVAEIAASCELPPAGPLITLYVEGINNYFEGVNFGEAVPGDPAIEQWDGEFWVNRNELVLMWESTKIGLLFGLCVDPNKVWRVLNGQTLEYSPPYDITSDCGG